MALTCGLGTSLSATRSCLAISSNTANLLALGIHAPLICLGSSRVRFLGTLDFLGLGATARTTAGLSFKNDCNKDNASVPDIVLTNETYPNCQEPLFQ
jgi:hypothetical protein